MSIFYDFYVFELNVLQSIVYFIVLLIEYGYLASVHHSDGVRLCKDHGRLYSRHFVWTFDSETREDYNAEITYGLSWLCINKQPVYTSRLFSLVYFHFITDPMKTNFFLKMESQMMKKNGGWFLINCRVSDKINSRNCWTVAGRVLSPRWLNLTHKYLNQTVLRLYHV